MKTEEEKQAETWWDSLSWPQQDYIAEKYYPNEIVDTLAKVVNIYRRLTKLDLVDLAKIKE